MRLPTRMSTRTHAYLPRRDVVVMALVGFYSRLFCSTTEPIQLNLQKLAAVNFGGYIYTSTDSGVNWTQRTTDASRDWWAIASSSDGTVRQV